MKKKFLSSLCSPLFKYYILIFFTFITTFSSVSSKIQYKLIPGKLEHIDIAHGGKNPIIIGVDAKGQAFQLNNDWKTWSKITATNNPALKAISVGTDNALWGIDKKNNLWKLILDKQKKPKSWIQIKGTYQKVSVGNKHEVWAVDPQKNLWRKKDPDQDIINW